MSINYSDPSMHVFACSADWWNVRMLLRKAERLGPTGSFRIHLNFRASRFDEHVTVVEKIIAAMTMSRFTR